MEEEKTTDKHSKDFFMDYRNNICVDYGLEYFYKVGILKEKDDVSEEKDGINTNNKNLQ